MFKLLILMFLINSAFAMENQSDSPFIATVNAIVNLEKDFISNSCNYHKANKILNDLNSRYTSLRNLIGSQENYNLISDSDKKLALETAEKTFTEINGKDPMSKFIYLGKTGTGVVVKIPGVSCWCYEILTK